MTHAEFFPYPARAHSIELWATCDHENAEIEHRTVDLQAVPDADHFVVTLRAVLADNVLETVLPEAERDDPPVDLVVALRGITARRRTSIRLTTEDGLTWNGSVAFAKRDLFGTLDAVPALVRTTLGDNPDYGEHLGATLATGEAVCLLVDKPPTALGDYLAVEFEDFSVTRKPHAKCFYLLDTSGDPPVLLLNKAIPEFKDVMVAKGNKGRTVRVRNAMFDSITSQVWTSLVGGVLAKLGIMAASDPGADALERLADWEVRVLNLWAQKLKPGARDLDTAVGQVLDDLHDAEKAQGLLDAVSGAVQAFSKTGNAFDGLIRLRDNDNP